MDEPDHNDPLRNAYNHVKMTDDSIRKTAKMFGVHEATLRTRLNNPSLFDSKVGRPTLFTKPEEIQLAEHCKRMSKLGYGYCRYQVMDLAKQMADAKGVETNPGKDWYYSFIKRFPDLSIQKPKKREVSRIHGTSETNVKNYFEELRHILEKYNLKNKPEAIWNVDETGITLDHNPPKIVSEKGNKPFVVTSGKSATTTVIAAGSALGETLPPYIIFKGQRLTTNIATGCLPGTKYITTETGWSNSDTFVDFVFNHFKTHVTIRPCLLLYDGHTTHISIDLIENAIKNNIHLFVLPPHSSHQLQPLDVGIFSPFKCALNSECHKLCHSRIGRRIIREDLPTLIAKAYESALTTPNLMSAFRKTGLVPFDPSQVMPQPSKEPDMKTPKSREERRNVRNIKLLLTEKDKQAVISLDNASKEKTRKYVIPSSGKAITEPQFLEKLKENTAKKETSEKKTKKGTKESTEHAGGKKGTKETTDHAGAGSGIKKVNQKRKATKEKNNLKEPAKKSKLKTKRNLKGNQLGTSYVVEDSQEPGQSSVSKEWVTFYKSESDDDENDDALCCVCGLFSPPGFGTSAALEFVGWAKCDKCSGWVHLKYCTSVRDVGQDQPFICPKC